MTSATQNSLGPVALSKAVAVLVSCSRAWTSPLASDQTSAPGSRSRGGCSTPSLLIVVGELARPRPSESGRGSRLGLNVKRKPRVCPHVGVEAGLVAYPNGSAQNQIRRSESRSIEPPRCSRMAPLVFQPKAPVCDVGSMRSSARTNNRDRRTAHGNGTAFSAVAPSERPVLPSIDPIFGSGIPPGPNSHPTFRSLFGSAFYKPDPEVA